MKFINKIVFIAFIILISSCSKNENTDNPETIIGTQYGFSVRGNGADENIEFTYKLFDKESGKVYHSGSEDNGDNYNAESFPITDDELKTDKISIEIKITSTITGRVENYFHVYNKEIDDNLLYMLDWDQNPDAATPFTMNALNYNSSLDIYEGEYPYRANVDFWFVNGRDNWADYKDQ